MITTRLPAQPTPQKKRGDKIRNWCSLFSFLLPWKSIYVFLPPDYCEFVQLAFVVKVKWIHGSEKKHGLGGICDVKHLID